MGQCKGFPAEKTEVDSPVPDRAGDIQRSESQSVSLPSRWPEERFVFSRPVSVLDPGPQKLE